MATDFDFQSHGDSRCARVVYDLAAVTLFSL
jgi:hypothetical protein